MPSASNATEQLLCVAVLKTLTKNGSVSFVRRGLAVNYLPLVLTECCVCVLPATEYHLGLLKAKLAKYRAQLLEPSKSSAAKGEGFDVMKSGDARVALIGFPSVGKVSECLCVPSLG